MDVGLYTFRISTSERIHPEQYGYKLVPRFVVTIHGKHGDPWGRWTADPHALAYLGQAEGGWFSVQGKLYKGAEDRTGFFLGTHENSFIGNLVGEESPATLATLFEMKGWNLHVGQKGEATISSSLGAFSGEWQLIRNKRVADSVYLRPRR